MIEVLASTPYMMNTMLGGMIGPTIEEAAVTETLNAFGSPCLDIIGIIIEPIAEASAAAKSR